VNRQKRIGLGTRDDPQQSLALARNQCQAGNCPRTPWTRDSTPQMMPEGARDGYCVAHYHGLLMCFAACIRQLHPQTLIDTCQTSAHLWPISVQQRCNAQNNEKRYLMN
jgi:hypothetical protein